MITFAELKEPAGGGERCLDPQLWHACAGGMVQMPAVHSRMYYFPQGHAEHADGSIDFAAVAGRVPPFILCRVLSVKFMADPESDEVFLKMRLGPLRPSELEYGEEEELSLGGNAGGGEEAEKPASFAKTLTQSDANNGGGFSVPRYCAETIFPRLDYTADPPVQTVLAKDVHGAVWKFRHIYRGTPRRHLLTTGWSSFVNHKKLIAGDSIVFLRTDNGELHVGIRRAKRNGFADTAPYNFSMFLREAGGAAAGGGNARGKSKVRPESVIEAANLAAAGQPFEVVYYPRASTPEFCVPAASVRAAMRVNWCPGMRFKMAFETEDSSRISWFMGTVAGVAVTDPIRWPQSPWRSLQVTWDEPELLHNVKRVSPWLVELVSSMPAIHLASFSPQRKKPRIPPFPEFPLAAPPPPWNVGSHGGLQLCYFPSSSSGGAPAVIQGARHAQSLGPVLPDLLLPPGGLFFTGFRRLDHPPPPPPAAAARCSTELTIGRPSEEKGKARQLVLFGKEIFTEQQISMSSSGGTTACCSGVTANSLSDGKAEKIVSDGSGSAWFELGLEPGQCRVFIESDDVGRTLRISSLASYDELYTQLAGMFAVEKPELANRLLYRDAAGDTKHIEDEPFSEFLKTARRLTILSDAGSDNRGSGS